MELRVGGSEDTLTLDHLSALPERNKDHFISSFTREQQHFFQQYLYEGQRVARSWDDSDPMSLPILSPVSPKNDSQLGFGTPVLRARLDLVSAQRSHLKGSLNAGRQESSKENERLSDHSASLSDAAEHDLIKSNAGGRKKKNVRDNKKRSREYNLRSDSEIELAERRAARRQRKKIKRNIMNPEFSGDNDNEDKPTCKVRKQAKRQLRLRQEFALMHGFSSTNVGKNRLTLKHSRRDVGVFQKGKASGKTEVIEVAKQRRQESDFIFSEADFLSKPRQNVSKAKVAKISTAMDSSVTSSVSAPTMNAQMDLEMVKVGIRKLKDIKVLSKSNPISKAKPRSQDKPQAGYNPSDSIVWDIEQPEVGSDVSSGVKQGTIVLKLDHLPLTSKETLDTSITTLEAHVKSPHQKSLSVIQSNAPSSPSLGPSQSASQIGLKTVEVASLPTVPSKYLKPLPPRLVGPHLALPWPSAVSEFREPLIIEDTIPQMPEPASHFLHSAGLSVRSYCDGQEGRPNLMPPMQPSYDLEVSVCGGYPDSEFWSPVDFPGDLGVERLDNVGDIDDIGVDFDSKINPGVVIPADDEVYIPGGELGEMDYTSFISLFEYESTEPHNSIPQSIWPGDTYSEVSERYQGVAYQDSGSKLLSLDLESEDQQMQPDGDFNPEHEEVRSTDLELYPDVVHHFWQGRSLLYGSSTPGDSLSLHKLSNVEAAVARQLHLDHWQPQKL